MSKTSIFGFEPDFFGFKWLEVVINRRDTKSDRMWERFGSASDELVIGAWFIIVPVDDTFDLIDSGEVSKCQTPREISLTTSSADLLSKHR